MAPEPVRDHLYNVDLNMHLKTVNRIYVLSKKTNTIISLNEQDEIIYKIAYWS